MKVLVTGACGFLGSTLLSAWRESAGDFTLYGIDNLGRAGSEMNRRRLLDMGVRLHHGDLRVTSDVDALPAMDFVIDAAALPSVRAGLDGQSSPRQLLEHNLLGTINLLEFARRHHAGFILLSTSRVYSIQAFNQVPLRTNGSRFILDDESLGAGSMRGLTSRGISEDFPTAAPLSLYGTSKLASEQIALEYSHAFDLPVWINRCGVLAGPGQFGRAEQGVFSYWVHAWKAGLPLSYFGYGGRGFQVRDLLHPRDLLPVLDHQLRKPASSTRRVFNLGGGADGALSLAELSAWCAQRYGPRDIGARTESQSLDVPWVVMDCAAAHETFDWRPAVTVDDNLRQIADFADAHPDWLTLTSDRPSA